MFDSLSRTNRRLLIASVVVLVGVGGAVLYGMYAPICCAPAPIDIER